MTPQEQAQVVMTATTRARCRDQWSTVNDPPCHPNDVEWNGCHLCLSRAGDAAAIRAAVDLVLPEDAGLCVYELTPREYGRLCVREEFLAIAAELEGPANG